MCVYMCGHAGPNAPLVLERGLTSCHMKHVYDFYKPAGFFPKVTHSGICRAYPDQPASHFVKTWCLNGVLVLHKHPDTTR